jgi:hypothetical protein
MVARHSGSSFENSTGSRLHRAIEIYEARTNPSLNKLGRSRARACLASRDRSVAGVALNPAHINETMSNRDAAIRCYRQAAASKDADAYTLKGAKSSLSRLGAN